MDGSTVALVSTLCSSALGALGLYLGYRARSQPFRQTLYTRQLDLLMEAAVQADSVHTACLRVLLASDAEGEKTARTAALTEGRLFQALLPKLSVLLPVEVWKAFVDFHEEAGRFLRDSPKRESRYSSLTERYARLAVPMRKFAGVDALSDENVKQFGSGEDPDVRVAWRLPPE
ncbi:MAG TPA: hypothetical protein VIV88_18775 [Gemmatimonadales bacterium]